MAERIFLISFLALVVTFSVVVGKTVVLIPIHATSHIRLFAHVGNELAKFNHTVWIGIPSGDRKRIDISTKVNVFYFDDFFESSQNTWFIQIERTVLNAVETGNDPDWGWLDTLEDDLAEKYLQCLKEGRFIPYIKSLNPDFIVIDWFPSVNNLVAIPYKLGLPFAVLSALQYPITAKMTYSPVSEAFNLPYILNQASLFEQFKAVYDSMFPLFNFIVNDRGHMKQIFPDDPNVPTTNELMSRAEIYIVENDPIFDYPRPSLPNLKLIGGLSAGPSKEIKDPFKSFIERSEKAGVGVVVLSFGSMFMNLPKKLELKLTSVFKRIKLNTIWRANITSPDPDKILISTWLPQNDLLGHKNVKVYMTHAGIHSTYEGIYHGVPTICMPLFYDQIGNSQRAEIKGYCITVDIIKITADELVNVIEKVASSLYIKSSIGKASAIYREIYKNPKQEAAFWIDHVIKYGGSYMRSSGQKISMYLYVLDYVIAFVAGSLLAVVIFIVCFAIRRIYKSCLTPAIRIKRD